MSDKPPYDGKSPVLAVKAKSRHTRYRSLPKSKKIVSNCNDGRSIFDNGIQPTGSVTIRKASGGARNRMSIFIHGLGLRGYRGIGSEWQFMPGFQKFNFFIGANNSGKSTVLNFIYRHLPMLDEVSQYSKPKNDLEPLEHHGAMSAGSISAALSFPVRDLIDRVVASSKFAGNDSRYRGYLIRLLESANKQSDDLWITGRLPYGQKVSLMVDSKALPDALTHAEWSFLWNGLTGSGQGSLTQHWIPETMDAIRRSIDLSLPDIKLIPAIREVGPKGSSFDNYSGSGLIDKLASLQNPSHDRRADRVKFDLINSFLKQVTDRPEAQIEIPHNRDHILVHMDGRILPLSSLGTGIHEVVMIAAFCTISDESIICIEEPEIHLHPLLQRKLMTYLAKQTKSQYFIATHSAAFIDTPGAAIFHVRLSEVSQTVISEAILRQARYAICVDLGHRASDIIQANSVIWVEGPSDRTYLVYWIKALAPDLTEGTDYSIMFYGGRLLSHLAADDDEVSEFIQLRNLNRNVAIVMDSDKGSAYAKLNETKKRLVKDFSSDGIAWVTKGREIENYIEHSELQRAVKAVYGSVYGRPIAATTYDHALHFERSVPKKTRSKSVPAGLLEKEVDKVKVSKAVVTSGPANLNILDLRERISELVDLIRRSNA